jgi:NAD(P)-dependent dehydrogenase (short-subunit alcohol dehydrogenase family)
MELKGKVAVVTGAGGLGSGRAEALRLAAEGCRVVVSDVDEAGCMETVRQIVATGGESTLLRCDVADAENVAALMSFAEQTYGGLHIVISNASAPYRPRAPFSAWRETIEVDLFGAIYGVQFALPIMTRRGGGTILNISSTSAFGHGSGHSGAPAYDIAKVGVLRLTTMLRDLHEKSNVRVNCLAPGWVAVPEVKAYYDALTPEQRRDPRIPPRLTTLAELTQTVVEVLRDEALAGRIVVMWSGQQPGLVAPEDPGYERLESYGSALCMES